MKVLKKGKLKEQEREYGNSALFVQFFYKPKTTLKKLSLLIKENKTLRGEGAA